MVSEQWQAVAEAVPLWTLGLAVAFALSAGVAYRLADPQGAWGRRVRQRLFLGLPWGTLVVVGGVLGIYLFVQGGLSAPRNPLVAPFRAWSYTYPLGILTAAFSHANLGHVTGNLVGTLAFAPLAEYAWSHFPTERGSQSFASLGQNPFVRIGVFVLGVVGVGLLTSVFAVGPVIGFSGVVFAFAGFALVYYPIPTVVALAVNDVFRLLYRAVQSPVDPAQAGTRFITPYWANVAIQGHAIGLLFGVLLGALVASRRGHRPDPGRLWLAVVVFAVAQSLWAVYWFLGGGRYVLFRAGGAILVFLLAALLAAALTASRRPLLARIDLDRREAAVGLLLSVTIALSVVAVPTNLVAVSDDPFDSGVEMRDYTVTYAENTPDQYVSPFDVGLFGEASQVNTSGVLLVSERRDVFQTVVPKSRLAFSGDTEVLVGGLGWRESVGVNLSVWRPVGNDSVYRVFLEPPDGEREFAYSSPPSIAESRVAGRQARFVPVETGFHLQVRRGNESLGRTPIPSAGTNVTTGGLTFNRTADRLYAIRNETRVRIAVQGNGD